jgi:phenylalanyl-tRNA synthetase beta chain
VDPVRVIPFSPDAARRFLDIDASDAELAERLERYGFRVAPDGTFDVRSGSPAHPERLAVWVPSWRLWDVEHDSDLYEELARSIGYDNTPIGLPPIDLGGVVGPDERVGQVVEDVLVGHGFFEVITDGFYSRALRDRLGVQPGHPLFEHVETANALDRAYSLLKNNGLAQAMECVATNVAVRNPDVKAYEFTRTFHPDPTAKNGVCTERRLVWAVASGAERPRTWAGPSRSADAAFGRGVVEQIAGALGLAWTFGPLPVHHPLRDLLHPGRQLGVFASGRVIGALGEVHPAVVAAFGLKRTRPVYLELDHAALLADGGRAPYEEPSRLQPVERSLAFTFAPPSSAERGRVTIADVVRTLFHAGPAWLLDVDVVDRFEHPVGAAPYGPSTLTWTFALRFENEAGGRAADAVNAAVEAMIARVTEAWGESGVSLRA